MQVGHKTQALATWTSIAATLAVLAKSFVPFYLIGSTAIFAASVAVGLALVAVSWRSIIDSANRVRDVLLVAALFYAVVMGMLGGLLPAIRAARLPVVTALREL